MCQVQARGSRSRITALACRPMPEHDGGGGGGSRSAVALCRKVSKGTNVNPFTPQELHSLSRTHAEPTPLQPPFQQLQGGRVSGSCANLVHMHVCTQLLWYWDGRGMRMANFMTNLLLVSGCKLDIL